MTEARITPIPSEEWSDDMWDAIEAIGAKRPAPGAATGRSSNILGIYANHPPLVKGWMPFSAHLKHSSLSDRVREIIIVRTTWLGRGEYEWAQHRKLALAAGLTQAEVDDLSQDGPYTHDWPAEDALVVQGVDEMINDRNVSDATWAQLAAQFTQPQLIDFAFMVSTYDMHCLAFNTLGLQLDPGLEGFSAHAATGA